MGLDLARQREEAAFIGVTCAAFACATVFVADASAPHLYALCSAVMTYCLGGAFICRALKASHGATLVWSSSALLLAALCGALSSAFALAAAGVPLPERIAFVLWGGMIWWLGRTVRSLDSDMPKERRSNSRGIALLAAAGAIAAPVLQVLSGGSAVHWIAALTVLVIGGIAVFLAFRHIALFRRARASETRSQPPSAQGHR